MRSHKQYLIISIICFIIGAYTLTLLSATGTPSTLVVRTDANNSLVVVGVAQTSPITQGIFSSRVLRTDSNGSLQVVLSGGAFSGQLLAPVTSTDCSAPQYSFIGDTNTGIGYSSADIFRLCAGGTVIANVGPFFSVNTLSFDTSNNDIRITRGATKLLNSDSSIQITRGTITTDLPVRTDTVTWNNGAVTFTGWKLVVTDTASAAGSLLMDLQVGAASKFSLTKAGLLTTITATVTSGANLNNIGIGSGHGTMNARFTSAGAALVTLADNAGTSGSVLEFLEQTAPSAGAANTARIYAVDNGAGKTQVCALFNTGAAQCFATQP